MNEPDRGDPDQMRDLLSAIQRTQSRIRDLESLVGMLVVRHGRDVGLGSWQLTIPEDEAFALRTRLPPRDLAVVMLYEDECIKVHVI